MGSPIQGGLFKSMPDASDPELIPRSAPPTMYRPMWTNLQEVASLVAERGEDKSCQLRHPRTDVPGARVVAHAVDARAEVPRGDEQIEVVGANVILCHGDDRARQRCLSCQGPQTCRRCPPPRPPTTAANATARRRHPRRRRPPSTRPPRLRPAKPPAAGAECSPLGPKSGSRK